MEIPSKIIHYLMLLLFLILSNLLPDSSISKLAGPLYSSLSLYLYLLVLFLIPSNLLSACVIYCFFSSSELKSMVGQIIHNDKYVLAVEQNKVLIPPNYNKYLAWGFSDLTIRMGNYESDKVSQNQSFSSLMISSQIISYLRDVH